MQSALELLPILEASIGKRPDEPPNPLPLRPSFLLILHSCGTLLLRLRKGLKTPLFLQSLDSLSARLKVESKRPLDGDLSKAELRGREHAAHGYLLFLPIVH